MPPELIFVLTAAAVILGGARLAHDGERIADLTGLGQGWVGAILVAGATSLPEIATDVAAVRQGESALAIGDLFGSSMANMLILGAADLFTRGAPLLRQVALTQAMVGVLAIGLTAIAAAAVVSGDAFSVFGIGWAPIVIAVAYVLGVRLIHTNREEDDAQEKDTGSIKKPVIGFVAAAAVILLAAPFLASSAATLAEEWGIASGFFGMVFLAAATSLPEVAVVWTALKAGASTLAVGNLFGSNCFNMVIFLVLDAVDGGGPLLATAEPGVVVGALFAIVLTGQALLDLLNRSEHRVWYIEPGPALLVLTYAAGLFLSYGATQ
jgi:cation:H+ antiporter